MAAPALRRRRTAPRLGDPVNPSAQAATHPGGGAAPQGQGIRTPPSGRGRQATGTAAVVKRKGDGRVSLSLLAPGRLECEGRVLESDKAASLAR